MKIKIIKYTLAGAAAGILVYLVRRKLIVSRKNRLQQQFVKDFNYQRRKYKDHFGEYTL